MTGRVVAGLAARRAIRGGAAWGAVFALVVASTAVGFESAYGTVEARQQLVRTLGGNAGIQALFGVTRDISTVKGFTAWRCLGVLPLVGAIWALLHATRTLQGEEDSGRLELLLAGPTTRAGAGVAAMAGMTAGLVAMFAVTAAGVLAVTGTGGFGVTAGLYFAVALVAAPAMFLAVGSLTSQLATTRRQAAAMAGGVFGVAYAIRLVADSGSGLRWLRWASPLGWVESLRPLTGSRPLALVPIAGLTLGLSAAAIVVNGARDYGTGALPASDTGPLRAGLLESAWRFSARLTRPRAVGWAAAIGLMAAVVGLVAKSVGEAATESEGFAEIIQRLGGRSGGAEAYLGLSFTIVAALLAFQAAGHVAATREEEADGQLDNLLVRPLSRSRWLLGRVATAFAALAAVSVLAGLASWVTAASQDTGVGLGRLLSAGMNVLPPAVLVLALGTLAHAVAPRRAVALTYGLVAWSFLVELVGSLVNASHWLLDLSLFHHIAPVPAVDPRWDTAALYVVLAAAAGAISLVAFNRRDLVGA